MAFQDCIAEVERAAGRKLSETELETLAEKVDDFIKVARLDTKVADLNEAVMKAADDFAKATVRAAHIERRNAALNKLAKTNLVDYVSVVHKGDYGAGLDATVGGIASGKRQSRNSVAASQVAHVNNYLGAFMSRLEMEGVHSHFTSGDLDREIWRAIEQLGKAEPDMKGIPPEAQTIAKIIDEHGEHARVESNKVGSDIGKLPGYLMRQSHDQYKIRAVPYEVWRKQMDGLDFTRSFPGLTPEKVETALRGMHTDFAAGVHVKFGSDVSMGMVGSKNIGKSLSHTRTLHWSSADAAFEYNQKFGSGSVAEGVTAGLRNMASSTALMKIFGPNAEATLDNVIQHFKEKLHDAGDPAALEKFSEKAAWIKDRLWPNITGDANIPHSQLGAKISAGVRALQRMSKLGGALLSAPSDIAFYASEVRYQGGNMLSGVVEAIGGLFHGKYTPEMRGILADIGVALDSQISSVAMGAARIDANDVLPGVWAKAQQLFFKANGLQWWTDSLRTTFSLMSAHRLARSASGDWDSLGSGMQRTFGLFGIDSGKWDIMRQGTLKEADGRTYLTPEGVQRLGDEPFAAYLTAKGTEPTAGRIAALRGELVDQFRTYYADRASYAVIEPDAKTRAYMYGSTRPGTWGGEALRHIMLFKSFTASVIQKPLSREIYGRGEQTELLKALRNGNGEILGLANLLVWSTVLGYGSMALKDLAKGKVPRDVTEDPVKVMTAAMLQGGALGIYGDFLFGEFKNRFGGSAVDTFAGPTVSLVNELMGAIGEAKEGTFEAGKMLRTVVNNTPYVNMFYTKALMDYAFMYQASESMSPGYLRRMERRALEEKNQTYLFPPSQAIPYGGGSRVFEGLR